MDCVVYHFFFKNSVQVFIKFTHSFVAIELLNFCKNAKNYFIAQESSRYSVRKQDWFLTFCVYKNVSQKNWFLYMYENYDDCHHRKTMDTFIYANSKKNCETFLYTKSQTLFKKLDNYRYVFKYKKPYTWRYGIFMKILKFAFIYKNHDNLRYVTFLYTKSSRHFAKIETICDTFYVQKFGSLRYAIFHWIFEICGGGAFIKKNNGLCVTFLFWKIMHFVLSCYIQRAWHYALHLNIQKNYTLLLTFI